MSFKTILTFIKFIAISFFVFFSINTAEAQESFPADSVKFIKKIDDFMSNTKDKDKAKKFFDELEKEWKEGVLVEKYRQDIYKLTNKMLERKARPYPHFETFFGIMIAFAKSEQSEDNYQVWVDFFSEMLDNKRLSMAKLDRFLDNSLHLIESNSLFKNTIVEWRTSSPDFKIQKVDDDLQVTVEHIDLTCFAKGDSTQIFNISGQFKFEEMIFNGKGGLVTWERSDVNKDSIYALLDNVKLDLKKSEYIIDTVLFYNKYYFTEPLYGQLHDKVVNTKSTDKLSYPKFDSFTKHFEMKDIFKDVNYSGGFSMQGSQFYGSGSKESPANLQFYRKDTLVLTARTQMFIFKPEQVLSSNASVTFKLEDDSIFHPGLKFNFGIKSRIVTLTRDKENIGRAPYINTYHNVDMMVGKLVWDMSKPKLQMEPGPIQKVAYFESADFYSVEKYFEIQKMDDVNPLVAVRSFVKRNGNYNEFYASEFADYMRMSEPAIHKYLLGLAFDGFITYDLDNDRVTVKEKLYHYLRASVGDKDYDVIGFISNTEGKNAEISLLTNELKLYGCDQIFLSDSQDVVVFPKNGEVRLKKDRDFSFDGQVNAGLFYFYGSNFEFSYKNFKIDFNNVERLQMHVKSYDQYDKYGEPILIPVQTPFHNIKGDLLIDKPFNKSGVKPSPEYPIFNSKKESYAYWDNPNIQNGAYKKDDFYFQVYPYSFDSLDNLERNSLVFDGYFNSANILPGFEEQLRLRPDYSLGFVRQTPPQGYPVYQGKGNLTGTTDLSNAGLLSEGELRYLTSVTKSRKMTLLPDVLKADESKFDNTKTLGPPEFPWVNAEQSHVDWYAYKDSLVTESVDIPIKMYNDQTTLVGATILQPTGMSGWGLVDLVTAELISEMFRFKENTFDADTSGFNLKTAGAEDFDFKTNNVNAHIDFNERKGIFKSNGEASFVEFPQNQYICFMDQFTWYMDNEVLEMSASEKAQATIKSNEDLGPIMEDDVELSGSQFISVHPRQDSLNFIAPTATYNMRTKLISAKDVKYIRVADAVIYPVDGVVEVEKHAVMRTLENSRIIANSATRYHTIFNAATNIYGRKEYTSSGDYNFYNEDSLKQVIHFDVVGVDSTMQTYGRGKIGVTENFTFNPYFAYNGKVYLYSNNQNLTFAGYTKISHECERTKPQWVKFKSDIDPKDIFIPVTPPIENINESILHASLMITNDSAHIYPAFLSPHEKYSDTELIPTEGYLIYDKQDGKYMIGSKDKLEEPSLPGNLVSLHHTVCNFYGEGRVGLGTDFGRFSVKSAGNINQNAVGESTVLNLVMFLEFYFNDKCLNIMAKDLSASGEGYAPEDVYYKGITEIVGREEAEEYIANLSMGSNKKYPKSLETGLLISEVKLKWDPAKKRYNSDGPIGIGSILKKQVNRLLDGHLQVIKKRSGDEFFLYLEVDENTWYYFHMAHNVLKAVSSNEEFNTVLRTMKPADRKLKAEKDQASYSFFPSTEGLKKKFLKQFEEGASEEGDEEDETAPEEEHF
ncbi:MAG: hypothetical protein JXR60_00375 [Bacteroidales bacterium]|nr:hypothetical protein [Bacteroidales bacterium]